MIVYHFLNAEYGLEAIRDSRLKVSRLMDINDPFELQSFSLSDKRFRKEIKKLKNRLAENLGVLCFSKTWKEPVLWSHYADRHQGICLGFEALADDCRKVIYIKNRRKPPPRIG